MRPSGPVARRTDYAVLDCPHRIVARLCREHHYARGAANTSTHAHCLRRAQDGEIVGGALWMPPTRRAAESVAGEGWRGVLCLSRLVVLPDEPTNTATLLLGASIRLIARDPRWHTLLTYADTGQGHTGTIYRATNWEPLGLWPGSSAWLDPATGRQVARKATHSRTVAEMLAAGYVRAPATPKHKFVYRLRR